MFFKSDLSKAQQGFTLIELLVVIAIAGILGTLAAPSVFQFARRSAMQSVSNDFTGGIQRARTEAVSGNICATICKSATTNTASPTCTPGASGIYASDDWHMGWIVFRNPTCDRSITTANPSSPGDIIIVRQPGDPRYTMVTTDSLRFMTFGPQGSMGAAGRFTMQDSQNSTQALNRSICVNILGRVRIIADGASC